jgi:hypothetical protein
MAGRSPGWRCPTGPAKLASSCKSWRPSIPIRPANSSSWPWPAPHPSADRRLRSPRHEPDRLAGRPPGQRRRRPPGGGAVHGEYAVRPPAGRAGQRPGPSRASGWRGARVRLDRPGVLLRGRRRGQPAPDHLREAQRSSAYVPLSTGDGPLVVAHRRAYPMLVGRDIEVDCRRRLGVRSFSSSLPPDLGLRTSFGREGDYGPEDRRDDPASGADTPLS